MVDEITRDGILTRPFRPQDSAALAALWVASWQETMPDIDFEARRGWVTTFLAEGAEAGRVTLVAEADGAALGFVTVEPALGYLHQLAVAPSAKGRGGAVVLLCAAKAAVPAGLTLDVNQANGRAVRFYEREGFRKASAGVNPGSGLATWRLRRG